MEVKGSECDSVSWNVLYFTGEGRKAIIKKLIELRGIC